ncbi:hypothetical protein RND71_008288 [Anisodus tanguticus]|uniref:Uncharacterized protein n=1 Tax=Anisodus tanguticus TaxID=243964 RepID=A0AAE1SNE3_9SOLA|nr:hypothetical protein RND71_008288 [Anisodus tanguticus]
MAKPAVNFSTKTILKLWLQIASLPFLDTHIHTESDIANSQDEAKANLLSIAEGTSYNNLAYNFVIDSDKDVNITNNSLTDENKVKGESNEDNSEGDIQTGKDGNSKEDIIIKDHKYDGMNGSIDRIHIASYCFYHVFKKKRCYVFKGKDYCYISTTTILGELEDDEIKEDNESLMAKEESDSKYIPTLMAKFDSDFENDNYEITLLKKELHSYLLEESRVLQVSFVSYFDAKSVFGEIGIVRRLFERVRRLRAPIKRHVETMNPILDVLVGLNGLIKDGKWDNKSVPLIVR